MNKSVLEKMLKDTGEFEEEHIQKSAQFIEGFVRKIINIKLPSVSHLFGLKGKS